MKTVFLLMLLAMGAGAMDEGRLADAIRLAEGSWTYGVAGVADEAEGRARCLGVVRPVISGWEASGKRGDPFELLASWYCPVNEKVWARNVRWFYYHPRK